MILKPQASDYRVIGFYLGKIALGLGLLMLIPLVLALLSKEFSPALDFLIASSTSIIIGCSLIFFCYTDKELNWTQGMIVVALAWIEAMFLGAIPLYLSGHFGCVLDACFESMSGFATTGLTLAQNLDHLSLSVNFWRHFTMFIGGQGIVVVVIALLVRGMSGALKMYVGEARDEKILPNIIQTARFIWIVSIIYFIIGALAIALIARFEGLSWPSAFYHGANLFMAGFDTGGFALHSQNIGYYHSWSIELATMFLMFLGALNFNLHYSIWTGNRKEIRRNFEIFTFALTLLIVSSATFIGLSRLGIYQDPGALFRRGFYQAFSAHTGTGFTNIYVPQLAGWNSLAIFAVIGAMGLGGSICSTTGGVKLLRIGVLAKAFVQDVKKILSSEFAIVVEKIHHIKDVVLEEKHVRSALMIFLAYLLTYLFGALVSMMLGFPFVESFFESTSAAANVGLSTGITSPAMPALLKGVFIIQMWMGRLEFMSIFVLIGFIVSAIKGK